MKSLTREPSPLRPLGWFLAAVYLTVVVVTIVLSEPATLLAGS